MNVSSVHVVFGAGQVGSLVAEELARSGETVRLIRRGPVRDAAPGITMISGDASDLDFCAEVSKGASVLYHCMTPTYDQWPALMPGLQNGVLHGAKTSGAKVVVLDNLYMYGKGDGGPFTEATRVAPVSRKGELRARLSEELFDAHARGDVRMTCGRASDFFGPGATVTSMFGDRFYQRLRAGKSTQVFGDPDMPHSYSYTPDVARGMVALGSDDRALGKVWHLPVAPAESTRAVVARFAAVLGVAPRISSLPTWALRIAGAFSPLVREVAEMTYQWRMPFVQGDRLFRETFHVGATPLDEAVSATVSWARDAYGIGRPDRSSHAARPRAYSRA